MRIILTTIFFIMTFMPVFSYQDCVITTDGKLTDIRIQHNDVIDVFPLITIMNDKNTLILHPLKTGKTKFSVLKNQKEKFVFDVNIREEATEINIPNGFEIFTIDCPPSSEEEQYIDIDPPPIFEEFELDTPPVLKEKM